MKKISINDLGNWDIEILSRKNLKTIMGGNISCPPNQHYDDVLQNCACNAPYIPCNGQCVAPSDCDNITPCSATATCGSAPPVTCHGTYDCVKTDGYLVACTHEKGTTVVKCPGVI
ncbi:hypothetical protein ACFSQW_04050 [Sphingobacterium tabacisoli]|uniref:Uncharacterized protein n=1 Tax=Sphingobacterium tabacisoli TaxID=2044855 RepID=A0ABW5KXV7_9SPHI